MGSLLVKVKRKELYVENMTRLQIGAFIAGVVFYDNPFRHQK